MASPFELEFAFTDMYRSTLDVSIPEREARCLGVLYPALFQELQPGDRFAGRLIYPSVGLGLELASGGPGYYCHADQLRRRLDE